MQSKEFFCIARVLCETAGGAPAEGSAGYSIVLGQHVVLESYGFVRAGSKSMYADRQNLADLRGRNHNPAGGFE